MSNTTTNKVYKIDGKFLSSNEVLSAFNSGPLVGRQRACIDLIEESANTIVDLGCYAGQTVAELFKMYPTKSIIGGDYTQEHIDLANLLHPDLPHNTFQILNSYDLALESDSIDCVLFQEVIEHLEGAAQAIKEINRVLKIGGTLIVSTPTPYYWKDMMQFFKFETLRQIFKRKLSLSDEIYFSEHEWNRHIYCWTPSTLYTLLKVNGFEYITHTYCREGCNFFEKFMLKFFPCFSPTLILKVKKNASASKKLI